MVVSEDVTPVAPGPKNKIKHILNNVYRFEVYISQHASVLAYEKHTWNVRKPQQPFLLSSIVSIRELGEQKTRGSGGVKTSGL